LPAGFTVNGAAVNANNQVVVGSAMESASLYVVDAKTWAASPLKMSGTVYHTSDLANSNLLASGDKPKATNIDLISRNVPANTGDSKINIYPNPVTNSQFTIQFNDLACRQLYRSGNRCNGPPGSSTRSECWRRQTIPGNKDSLLHLQQVFI
jgi:hypothetical protein